MGEAKRKREAAAKALEETGGYEAIEPAPDPDLATEDFPAVEQQEEGHEHSLLPQELRTAFLVLVSGENGTIEVCDDITVDCILDHAPLMDEIYGAMAVLLQSAVCTSMIAEEMYDTGFLVVLTRDGNRVATNDINRDWKLDRHATVDDVRMAAAVVTKDILVMEAGNYTLQMQMRTAAQMAEQQRIAKVSAKLQQRGIHVPPGGILRP